MVNRLIMQIGIMVPHELLDSSPPGRFDHQLRKTAKKGWLVPYPRIRLSQRTTNKVR